MFNRKDRISISVSFELRHYIYPARPITRARASIIFMSMILRSTVPRFFSHTEEGSYTRNVCLKEKNICMYWTLFDISLLIVSPY